MTLQDDGVERARIEAGIPSAGHELSEEIIPVEAGLGHTISYTKGCYGQEVIAKIKYLGEPPKTLVNLKAEAPLGTLEGELTVWNGEKRVGFVTSWEAHGTDEPACIALVKPVQYPLLRRLMCAAMASIGSCTPFREGPGVGLRLPVPGMGSPEEKKSPV